ncbi:MAG TPA: ribulokinase [Chitinophagaceae bacterium]|nr:ribulokinase [Chitinophagaceae bacterium]
MNNTSWVIGIDFGTDSVRSIVVNAFTGEEAASSLFEYPRWKSGLYSNPSANLFRQHPLDYLEGLENIIPACLQKLSPEQRKNVRGIGIDTTGSTPVAVDITGTPLALLPAFAENPHAMFVLWKDHTAIQEAAEINRHAEKFPVNYLQYVGGIYSSEWYWAKLLHTLRADESVRKACYSWVEHCDWIPFVLTGGREAHKIKRGVCSAGHKALWSPAFNGFPPDVFFSSLDPMLKGYATGLSSGLLTADQPAGGLSAYWAAKLGLPEGITVAAGAFDAHMGAVGGQIEPYYLSKVMGTSTCDMLVAPLDEVKGKLVKGICGQVPGSIIPGMMGMEAGQSAFGDAYAWFKNLLAWPLRFAVNKGISANTSEEELLQKMILDILPALSREAEKMEVTENAVWAIDWFNGRRTPDANQALKGAINGISLASDAPALFRAVAESTCFGARAIVDRLNSEGIPIKGLIGLGGVSRKSPFIMQMLADITGMNIRIHRSEQTCALGAAMFAATAAGLHQNIASAMQAMGTGFEKTYHPNNTYKMIYQKRYQQYKNTGAMLENMSLQNI